MRQFRNSSRQECSQACGCLSPPHKLVRFKPIPPGCETSVREIESESELEVNVGDNPTPTPTPASVVHPAVSHISPVSLVDFESELKSLQCCTNICRDVACLPCTLSSSSLIANKARLLSNRLRSDSGGARQRQVGRPLRLFRLWASIELFG